MSSIYLVRELTSHVFLKVCVVHGLHGQALNTWEVFEGSTLKVSDLIASRSHSTCEALHDIIAVMLKHTRSLHLL